MGRDVARNTSGQAGAGSWFPLIGLGGLIALAVTVWACLTVGETLAGGGQDIPGNPAVAVIDLAQGQLAWTTGATVVAASLGVIALVIGAASAVWSSKRRGTNSRVDHIARNLAGRKDIKSLSAASVSGADRRGGRETSVPGVFIGKEVATGQDLWGGWEDLHLDLWGPRQGKTSSRIIPMIRRAPGICISTSCKRDVVEATIDYRAAKGRVWVLDPQDKAVGLDTSKWFFDPLDYVRRDKWWDGNAEELAEIFNAASSRGEAGSDPNAYFYSQAVDLLASLFLAAAMERRPITDVYGWVSNLEDSTPVDILSGSQWGPQAADLASKYAAEPRTRSNVFSAAKNMISCLGRRQIVRWLTPQAGAERFDPVAFAKSSGDTLYLVSDEENPIARPLTSILTVAVFKALVDRADQCPGSRLPVPVTAALDEIANIVRWPRLPDYYSTFGSRGIICDTVLQSYAQGVELWGEQGMKKLWSAAAIVVIGPGHKDYRFLDELAHLIGTHTERQRSISNSAGGGGRSVSTQTVEKQTITAAELAALPFGRMVVLATGRRPILARMVRWDQQDLPSLEQMRAAA
ncbi:type IV secretory system conjugative DNA transfer family protein [Rhodococcus sp. IEGM 1408]|uniref:type IV secretory system conjugative DNA transfer family protein n=1 Tax=Rhodococcus sp. IEGM 1408 TaxID=3082220 RepID=UPI002955DF3C|nr:TraM recognition domain-containing protein [Rhodococcus sp. IEGM 1408]MDV8002839.1 TraM recognition domain-containing protein [Rhodococcus sp. IEGM 1408]